MIIAQITDSHVAVRETPVDKRFATAKHLEQAVTHLMLLPKQPDIVIVTGDCAESGSIPEYELFRQLLQPLDMPVYVIPGNHDNRENLHQVFGDQGDRHDQDFMQYVVEAGAVRLIALDTVTQGRDRGELCHQRLAWLEERLNENRSSPTILFQHHPPFPIGIPLLDRGGFGEVEAFGRLVESHPNIERIMAGHVHCHVMRRFHGTMAVACPSTAHQIHVDLRQQKGLSMAMTPPVALLHFWTEQTGLLTYTSSIGDYGPPLLVYDGKRVLI